MSFFTSEVFFFGRLHDFSEICLPSLLYESILKDVKYKEGIVFLVKSNSFELVRNHEILLT